MLLKLKSKLLKDGALSIEFCVLYNKLENNMELVPKYVGF